MTTTEPRTGTTQVLTDEMLARTNIIKMMSKPFGVRDLLTFVQEKLVPAGLEHARQFTWRAAGEAFLAGYEEASR